MHTQLQPRPATTLLSRAWYSSPISGFLASEPRAVLGDLATRCEFELLQSQRDAWLHEIAFLQQSLQGLDGTLFLEFNIPRMGRRIDAVLVIGAVLFIVEFKVGGDTFERAALDQVWDYALDLKNFHEASHHAAIVPVLVATQATTSQFQLHRDYDMVYRPIAVHPQAFREAVQFALRTVEGLSLDPVEWAGGRYRPTPTILEAARALYAKHSVEEIARHDAGAQNLALTSRRIEELVEQARTHGQKIICFVTGVPGAGKTLVGLNAANQHRKTGEETHAVFLSGNGPLVAVLTEALTRDEYSRRKQEGEKVRKADVKKSVNAFIQIVHHFRDEALRDPRAPVDHVAIFDEAQRAWNLQQTANFMARKKGVTGFDKSEPEFLISYMDRHTDWAVIICLVGGGQEINIGEAGIDTWVQAVTDKYPHWQMVISSRLSDSEYGAGHVLDSIRDHDNTRFDDSLHLSVSMRSFRAENVSLFVKSVLDCEVDAARAAYASLQDRFPMAVTRNLDAAKAWIREHARGTERYGLVASSKAMRLKPHAIDIRVDVDPVHYFLNDRHDTRSSYYLEDAATEFQVQGLELDWVCVTWDGDLRFNENGGWSFNDFRGDKWTKIHNLENQSYLRNAYRVLLTRARQGMVIFVPPGDETDPTRLKNYYDPVYNYLTEVGIQAIA